MLYTRSLLVIYFKYSNVYITGFFFSVCGLLTVVASPVVEHRLQTCRLSGHGSWAQPLRGMWDLPRPGLEPVSPALAGGFFFFFFFCGTRASHCCGLSRCGAQAPDMQAQRPWLMGPAAPRHAGSSRTGARTRVPCISRQTLNHGATREAPGWFF